MENVLSAVSSVAEEAEQVSYPGNDSSKRKSNRKQGSVSCSQKEIRSACRGDRHSQGTAFWHHVFKCRCDFILCVLGVSDCHAAFGVSV